MLRIAVVDDEPHTLKKLQTLIYAAFDEHSVSFEIEAFSSGTAFLERHSQNHFNVVFLDIIMPEIGGFEVAQAIRNEKNSTYIIFITNENNLVFDGYNYKAFDFICKSLNEQLNTKLSEVVKRLLDDNKQYRAIILDLSFGDKRMVQISDITYVQYQKNYMYYKFLDKTHLVCREKFSDAEERLVNYDFAKVNKSILINLRYVDIINKPKNRIILREKTEIILARPYRKNFDEKYDTYLESLI